MKTCGNTGNCRLEYFCVFPDQITMSGGFDPMLPDDERVARIIDLEGDKADAKICAALSPGVDPDALTQPQLDAGL
jgi:hypothetical protein